MLQIRKLVVCAMVIGAHLGASTQALASAYPQSTAPLRSTPPLEWLPGGYADPTDAAAAQVVADVLAPSLPKADDEDEFGEVDQDVATLSDLLEEVAELTRRVRPEGTDPVAAATLASRSGDGDPLVLARAIVELTAAAGNDFELEIEADWEDEGQDMARAGLPAAVAQRRGELMREFRQQVNEFRWLSRELDQSARSGDRASVAAALVALTDWIALQQTARGYRAIDKSRLPFALMKAGQVPEPGAGLETDAKSAKNLAGPVAADLAETEEVRFTPEIRALAQELGGDPVAIRNWVYNHIEFTPTHGSIQGAALTLLNRSGNAMDIASLTIALLRSAGIPARYAYGVVEIPEGKVRNWLGDVPTGAMAVDVMGKGQIPTVAVMQGGAVRNIRFEHAWVEAYVDFVPSRGARNRVPDQWVPIDASFKQFEYDKATAWRERTAPGFSEAAQDFARGVTVAADGGITGFDYEALDAALQQVAREEGARLEAEGSGPADLYDRRTIVPVERLVLEGALPYAMTTATPTRFSAVPSRYQHALRVQYFADETSLRYDSPTAVVDIPLARIGTQRLHVDNVPASDADAQAIAQYEALNAQSMPVGQINVRPELKLGATTVMPNGSVRMGTQLIWTTDLKDSHGGITTTEPYRFAAGSPIAFVVNHAGVTPGRAERETAGMPDRATLPIKDVLYFGGLTYWMLHDRYDAESALALGGRALRMPSVGAFASPLQVSYFFGVPRTGHFKGYVTDVKASRLAITAPTAQAEFAAGLHLGAGGSLFEGTAWNLIEGAPFDQQTLSAAALLRWAIDQKQPIFQITATNVDTVLARLQLSADAESEIANAAKAGLIVIAHQREIQHRGWSGSGYVLIDLSSGSALQRVEGGFAGGIIVGCLARAVSLKGIAEMMIMRLATKYLMRLFAGVAARLAASAALAALLGPAGVAIGGIITIVAVAVSYAMALYEVYTWIRMIQEGIEALTPEQLAELGIAGAIGSVLCSSSSPCGGGGSGPGGPTAGNPTAIGSGSKWQREVDYEAQGAFPLLWERTYSSAKPRGRGYVGGKWTANYFARLHLPPSVSGSTFPEDQRPDSILLSRPDGGWFQFDWRSDKYVGDSNLPGTLTRLTSGDRTTGFEFRSDRDELERYDANGRLLSIQARGGETHTLVYDTQGRLERVSDHHGRRLAVTYDPDTGYVAGVTLPDDRVIAYRHDESGNLIEVVYPDQRKRRYHYENLALRFHLTGITDERGNRIATWEYDTQGRVVRSERADGADRYVFRYEVRRTVVIDPHGGTRTYDFALRNDRQYLVSATQPCSTCGPAAAGVTYDGNGYVASERDFRGTTTTYVRDARGLVTSTTQAAGTALARTTTTTWHPVFRVPTRVTEPVVGGTRVTEFTWDERGNMLTRKVTAAGRSRLWTFTYHPGTSLVLTEDGPRTDVVDVTSYTHDAQGNLATETNAAGHVTRYPKYNAHGQPLQVVDPNGLERRYAYDERQRVESVTAGGEVTRYSYDAAGQLERETRPDGSFVDYAYDGAGRLTSVKDSLGNRIEYTLNGNGDRTAEWTYDPSGALARSLTRAIDVLGRVESESGSASIGTTRFGYDANGNETRIENPLEHATLNQYDALGRPETVTDPADGVAQYRYDNQNNLSSVIDPRNLTTRYAYSGFDEVSRVESPDTGVTQLEYDDAGNQVRTVDSRGVASAYRYDALDRLVEVEHPATTGVAAERIAFGYDELAGGAGAKGRTTSASSRGGSLQYVYDDHGRLDRKTQVLGDDTVTAKTVSYDHDPQNGRLDLMTLPSGAQIRYGYGADGRVMSIVVNGQTIVREIEYFPYGEPRSWRYGAAGRYVRTFDTDGQIVGHTAGRSVRTIGYDAAGRVTSIADDASERPVWTFGYDPVDRLTAATNETGTGALAGLELTWEYDATGNRTRQTLTRDGATTATDYAIAPTSNRVTAVGTEPRSYDAAGNSTAVGTRASVYSGGNRLVEVRDGGAVVARYAHDAYGQRICKALAGAACPLRNVAGTGSPGAGPHTQFVYDESGRLVGEYDENGAMLAEHVWLDSTPIATLRASASAASFGGTTAGAVSVFYVHPDHLDTPRYVVNASDVAVWRWDSAPYGDVSAQQNPEGLGLFEYALRFPGQYADPETGSHYNYFRDYEPSTGRYLQSDPIGLDGGLSTYGYVENDPLGSADAEGLARCPWALKLLGLCKPRPPRPDRPRLKPPLKGGGLYIVRDCKGNVVYVGQTNSFRTRTRQHWGSGGQFSAFNSRCCPISVFWVPMPVGPRLDALEKKVIGHYRPPGNSRHNPNPRPYTPPNCCI